MTFYEQLAAVDTLLREVWMRKELWAGQDQDKEALRAWLREGPFGERPDGQPWPPDFPFEELTMGLIHTIASGTEQLYRRLRDLFPETPGSSRVVSDIRILSWEVRNVESEPPSSSGSS